MQSRAPRVCVVSATPLTMFFFFSEHLRELSKCADITVAYNKNYNSEVQPINAPVLEKHLDIQRGISFFKDFKALISMIIFFKKNKFDMVITLVPKSGLLGMLAARFCRIPVRLNIFQGEAWSVKVGATRVLLKLATTLTAICSTNLLAVSNSQRNFLIREGIAPAAKVVVLGSGSIAGVDLKRFQPNQESRKIIRGQYNINDGAKLLLFVGRITRDKGVVHLVRTFAKILIDEPNTFLIIVGPDEEGITVELQSLINRENQHKLIFTGFTARPESFMAAADILCLPSLREGFGMVALEAAACALPCVGSNIYGLRDAIADKKSGLLVAVEDENALLDGLKTLIYDLNLCARLGNYGRLRVLSDFDSQIVVGKYLTYFKERLNI